MLSSNAILMDDIIISHILIDLHEAPTSIWKVRQQGTCCPLQGVCWVAFYAGTIPCKEGKAQIKDGIWYGCL
jgi:hypothetical protein